MDADIPALRLFHIDYAGYGLIIYLIKLISHNFY